MRPIIVPLAALLLATGCGPPTSRHPSTPAPARSSAPPARGSTGHIAIPPTKSASSARLEVTTLQWRLPASVAREAVSVRGQQLVVAGGLLSGDRSTANSYLLDPVSGRTTRLRALQVPVHDTAGVYVAGRSLVVGGGNASEQSAVQARGAGDRWSTIGLLPQTRSDLSAVIARGRVIVLGGYDATSPAVPSIVASADGRGWSRIGTLRVPVRYAASAVVGTNVWMFGGERSGAEQTVVQKFDVSTGVTTVVAQLPHPLGHAMAMVLGNRILVVGGRTSATAVTGQMWWFDQATHTFSRAGRLPQPLADSAVATVGGAAYLVGGESPSLTDRVVRLVSH